MFQVNPGQLKSISFPRYSDRTGGSRHLGPFRGRFAMVRLDIFTAAGLIKETALIPWTARQRREDGFGIHPNSQELERYLAFLEVRCSALSTMIGCHGRRRTSSCCATAHRPSRTPSSRTAWTDWRRSSALKPTSWAARVSFEHPDAFVYAVGDAEMFLERSDMNGSGSGNDPALSHTPLRSKRCASRWSMGRARRKAM